MNIGYEDDELKPYIEPAKDVKDENRIAVIQQMGYSRSAILTSLEKGSFDDPHAAYILLGEKKREVRNFSKWDVKNLCDSVLQPNVYCILHFCKVLSKQPVITISHPYHFRRSVEVIEVWDYNGNTLANSSELRELFSAFFSGGSLKKLMPTSPVVMIKRYAPRRKQAILAGRPEMAALVS